MPNPSYLFKTYGDPTEVSFKRNQVIETPDGPARFYNQFSRGLRYYVNTSLGTYKATTIAILND